MATVMYIPEKKQSLGAMKGVMGYVCQEKKTRDPVTGQRFVTGVHCLGDNACREFLATKRTYGKTKGMNFYQYVQSFSPKEAVTLEKAHAIALEFAQKAWPGFEVLVATHRDAGHLYCRICSITLGIRRGKMHSGCLLVEWEKFIRISSAKTRKNGSSQMPSINPWTTLETVTICRCWRIWSDLRPLPGTISTRKWRKLKMFACG